MCPCPRSFQVVGIYGNQAWRHDFFGPDVNLAARIGALAQGGQTLISGGLKAKYDDELSRASQRMPWRVVDRGAQQLKGIETPCPVFELVNSMLSGRSFTPFKSAGASRQQQLVMDAMLSIHKSSHTTKTPSGTRASFAGGTYTRGASGSGSGGVASSPSSHGKAIRRPRRPSADYNGMPLPATSLVRGDAEGDGADGSVAAPAPAPAAGGDAGGGGLAIRTPDDDAAHAVLATPVGASTAADADDEELRVDDFTALMFTFTAITYAASGDATRLATLLESVSDWDPTTGDYDFRTPLHLAACSGSVEAARVLLDHGADPSARDRWDRTPLDDARSHESHDVLQLLLERGATERTGSPMRLRQERDSLLPSQLCLAASSADHEGLGTLLQAHPHMVSAPDYDGRTALHLAVASRDAKAVELLVKHGADTTMKDRWGNTPVDDVKKFGGGSKELLTLIKPQHPKMLSSSSRRESSRFSLLTGTPRKAEQSTRSEH